MSTPERTIVITGASSGFGAAAVRAFADRGDRVWGTMRDTAGRNAAKKAELEGYSPASPSPRWTSPATPRWPKASPHPGRWPHRHPDQQRGHHVYRHDRGLQRRAGRGTDGHQLFRGHPRDAGGAAVDARGRRGLIINTSSLAGRVSVPFFGTYCATKHALEAYSQSLRYEVAPFGIDVALVEPGPFPSNLLAAGKPPARADVLASYGDLGRCPTPWSRVLPRCWPAMKPPTRNWSSMPICRWPMPPRQAPHAHGRRHHLGRGRGERLHPAAPGRAPQGDAARHRARRCRRLTTPIPSP
jgi:NAD(P)-dependent dehydrogenase (short-subunit alcohol dehydrogenase family)